MQQAIINSDVMNQWKINDFSDEQIATYLKENNVDEVEIANAIKSYKKSKADNRQQNGFIIATIGGLLCFISCIFTLINIIPDLRTFILYGLTTIGIILIVIGLYFIFED